MQKYMLQSMISLFFNSGALPWQKHNQRRIIFRTFLFLICVLFLFSTIDRNTSDFKSHLDREKFSALIKSKNLNGLK